MVNAFSTFNNKGLAYKQRGAHRDGRTPRPPPDGRVDAGRLDTIRKRRLTDEHAFSLDKLKSWSFILTVLVSGLIGASINNAFDVSKWLIIEWIETDRERVSLKNEIIHTLLQIEKLDKAIMDNRTSHTQDKEALTKDLDGLKKDLDMLRHQLSRIEYRVNWFHAPGDDEERRDLEEFRAWQQQQKARGGGQWNPEAE
jgi:hypothetical protein